MTLLLRRLQAAGERSTPPTIMDFGVQYSILPMGIKVEVYVGSRSISQIVPWLNLAAASDDLDLLALAEHSCRKDLGQVIDENFGDQQ